MPIPTEGQSLTTAKGVLWLVEAVNGSDPDDVNEPDYDPAFFVVDLVLSVDAHDLNARRIQLDNMEFEQFCRDEGIALT